MNETELFEQAKLFLPKYLSPAQYSELYSELKAFPDITFYMSSASFNDTLCQGDGWRGFVVVDFRSGERKTVTGMILSNTCDVDISNDGKLTPNVLFAPIVRLTRYTELLEAGGMDSGSLANHLREIRGQYVTNVLWLPQTYSGTLEESVVLLDSIHAHPLDDFSAGERHAVFTLSQPAFYLLVLKLSIHFCRMQEGIARFD